MQKFIQCRNRKEAKFHAPWAAAIVKVSGGYQAFEFICDWEIWKNQK